MLETQLSSCEERGEVFIGLIRRSVLFWLRIVHAFGVTDELIVCNPEPEFGFYAGKINAHKMIFHL